MSRRETPFAETATPLTIAHVAEPASGGIGRHVLDLAEGLARRGHHVLVAHGTERLGHGFSERARTVMEGGVSFVPVPSLRRGPGISDLFAARELRRALLTHARDHAQKRVDVLHLHSTKAGILGRTLLADTASRRLFTPHAPYSLRRDLGLLARAGVITVERALALMPHACIAVAQDEANHLTRAQISGRELWCIPNAVEPSRPGDLAQRRAAGRARLGASEGDVVVGFIGRLSHQKAPGAALEILRRVAALTPDVRCVLVGDGASASLERDIRAAPGVQWIANGLGPEIIPAFDILLCTSRYEGFPYVFLEALDAGCAIVTTPVGGAFECVGDGTAGVVVPFAENDEPRIDWFVSTLAALLRDRSRLAALQQGARARALHFTLDQMVTSIEAAYHGFADVRETAPAPYSSFALLAAEKS